ncbi:MAG: efflux RND transporter periplasmic adaptor subunit, partial [Gemmatimonadetes bacterium]|nr:efflux RND transporter periplasmic adaptor subunit [Gemmatimonadota bacterium]
STLFAALLRLIEPDAGSISIDGTPIADLRLPSLRARIAYVPQENLLFGASIRDNILYGRPEADEEDVVRAATLAQARAAAVGATRTAELAVLRSPLDGIVTQVSATLGASVDPGTVLVEVIDPTALDIDLDLGPADASRLRPGMIGLVTGAASAADTLGEATVRTIAGTVDSMGGAVRVRVRIVTPRRTLRGGEPVRAVLRLAPLADVVLVPVAALVPEGDAEVVFVVDDARVVHRRVVAVGDRDAVHAVVASGLQPGERVVTVGAYGMVDGARAVVDTTGAP